MLQVSQGKRYMLEISDYKRKKNADGTILKISINAGMKNIWKENLLSSL